jgi:hypothetical protein
MPKLALVAAKNLLVCVGIFYLSRWVAVPLDYAFGKLTTGVTYYGDFEGYVVMPVVFRLPVALVAGVVGACAIWVVDSVRPLRWVVFVSALYTFFGFFGYHWAHHPLAGDRIFQAVSALFPGATCFIGGLTATRWRVTSRDTPTPV